MLLTACGQVNESSDSAANGTAIAVAVQTINAGATPVSASPTALPAHRHRITNWIAKRVTNRMRTCRHRITERLRGNL